MGTPTKKRAIVSSICRSGQMHTHQRISQDVGLSSWTCSCHDCRSHQSTRSQHSTVPALPCSSIRHNHRVHSVMLQDLQGALQHRRQWLSSLGLRAAACSIKAAAVAKAVLMRVQEAGGEAQKRERSVLAKM